MKKNILIRYNSFGMNTRYIPKAVNAVSAVNYKQENKSVDSISRMKLHEKTEKEVILHFPAKYKQ